MKIYKYIKQSKNSSNCGPYALWMLNEFHNGYPYSPRQLIRLCKTTNKWGTEDEDLIEAAQKIGYQVDEIKPTNTGIYFPLLMCFMDSKTTAHWTLVRQGIEFKDHSLFKLNDSYYGENIWTSIEHSSILSMYRLIPMWESYEITK